MAKLKTGGSEEVQTIVSLLEERRGAWVFILRGGDMPIKTEDWLSGYLPTKGTRRGEGSTYQ